MPAAMVAEGVRMANICNACRYCEGYCAVFPALERRLSFAEADMAYLANLCHNCGACYYACPYAPPHDFQLNLPKMLAELRQESYRKYAWPGFLAGLFGRNGLAVSIVTGVCLAVCLSAIGLSARRGLFFSPHADAQGAFYFLVTHDAMVAVFAAAALFVGVALWAGFWRFWKDVGAKPGDFFNARAFGSAVRDVLKLRYLDGGGEGCTYPREEFSQLRRWYHHLTFYGFMLSFAATTVAAFYDNFLGWKAPYPFWSLPVLLGAAGGVGLIIGPAGLLWLKSRRDTALAAETQTGMDVGFLVLLLFAGVSGLLLLAFRESAAMGILLALHLGVVMALFLTMPYGKFVHAVYRFAALVRFHRE